MPALVFAHTTRFRVNEAEFRRRRVNNRQATPVDECPQHGAITKMGQDGRNPCSVEREKLGFAHASPEAIANSR